MSSSSESHGTHDFNAVTPPINSVSPERLDELAQWAASEEADCLHDDMPISAGYYADIIKLIAARRAANTPVDGVWVKPLEWQKRYESEYLSRAETILGVYRVWSHHAANGEWFWSLAEFGPSDGSCDTEEAAKAACQADFNARIQSCLE